MIKFAREAETLGMVMKNEKRSVFAGVLCLAAVMICGCKPEIAVVLEDYCAFQKGCEYVNVNQETQYHNLKTCDSFHRELLDNTAKGKSSGCKEDVTEFFIEYMNAQMALSCEATLMDTFNDSQATRAQMVAMVSCIRESSESGEGDISSDDVADMGLGVVETLELDIEDMSVESCETLIGTIMPEKVEIVCPMVEKGVFREMTKEACDKILPYAMAGKEALAGRICALFPTEAEKAAADAQGE